MKEAHKSVLTWRKFINFISDALIYTYKLLFIFNLNVTLTPRTYLSGLKQLHIIT